jgi:hypothetical protein
MAVYIWFWSGRPGQHLFRPSVQLEQLYYYSYFHVKTHFFFSPYELQGKTRMLPHPGIAWKK